MQKTKRVSTDTPGLQKWKVLNSKGNWVDRIEGNRYFAYIRPVPGADQLSQSFRDKDEAVAWLKGGYLQRSTSDVNPDGEGMTFKALEDAFFARKVELIKIGKFADTTLQTYQNVAVHFGYLYRFRVHQITQSVVSAWIRELKKEPNRKKTRQSFHNELDLLRTILNFYSDRCAKDDGHEDFPMPVKPHHFEEEAPVQCLSQAQKPPTKYIERDVYLRWLEQLRTQKVMPRGITPEKATQLDRLIYLVARTQLKTGARVGEVCAISWDDVKLSQNSISISKTVHWRRGADNRSYVANTTKTGINREVGFADPELIAAFHEMKAQRPTGLVFSLDGQTPLEYRWIQSRYNKAFIALQLPWRSTHTLRHSFGTDLLDVTQNKTLVQGAMGHTSERMTAKYAKPKPTTVVNGMAAYEASFKKVSPESVTTRDYEDKNAQIA